MSAFVSNNVRSFFLVQDEEHVVREKDLLKGCQCYVWSCAFEATSLVNFRSVHEKCCYRRGKDHSNVRNRYEGIKLELAVYFFMLMPLGHLVSVADRHNQNSARYYIRYRCEETNSLPDSCQWSRQIFSFFCLSLGKKKCIVSVLKTNSEIKP